MASFMTPYLIGVVSAPLAAKVVKPLLRGTVKTAVGLVVQVRKLAVEASEEFQGLAAEASTQYATQDLTRSDPTAPKVTPPLKRGGTV